MSLVRRILEAVDEALRVCGWCKKVLGDNPDVDAVTHGICDDCAQKMLAGWRYDQETGKWTPPKDDKSGPTAAGEGERT